MSELLEDGECRGVLQWLPHCLRLILGMLRCREPFSFHHSVGLPDAARLPLPPHSPVPLDPPDPACSGSSASRDQRQPGHWTFVPLWAFDWICSNTVNR
ncbi:hypothetical protein AAFF_G00074240 [Aldrovandia affinis]|uniref:Uncharacterized protein n=1 Tax=Aldrovandia affinis TaxID=143900 RepID=A0AAD7WCY7_9TELE|nr:hypothetical protein AAFF_G00074240 [Aldrovandia affinis]